jgi:hypothetical protein
MTKLFGNPNSVGTSQTRRSYRLPHAGCGNLT